jgi:DNA-binding CsgD family transcriptional regulator
LTARCEGGETPSIQGIGGRDQLTGTEHETALLAAAGASNKAIAVQLQLSIRTIETRLQHAYHKLGVPRREDLAAVLPADGQDGSAVS